MLQSKKVWQSRCKKHKRPAQNERQKSPKWAPEIVKTSTRNRQNEHQKSSKRAPEIAKFRSKKDKRPAQQNQNQ